MCDKKDCKSRLYTGKCESCVGYNNYDSTKSESDRLLEAIKNLKTRHTLK